MTTWWASSAEPWDTGLRVVRQQVTPYDADDDPVVLQSVRDDHLRVTNDSREDRYIQSLITTSLLMAQRRTQRRLLRETWKLVMSGFPSAHIELPYPPLIAVTSITYIDSEGDTQTMDADEYEVDAPIGPEAVRGRVRLVDGGVWPTPASVSNAVTVTFRTGYVTPGVSPETVDVPADITHARLLVIKDLYEHRGISFVGAGNVVSKAEITANDIWDHYRDRTVSG